MKVLFDPSTASKTMRARIAKACAVLGRRLHDSSSTRCSAVIAMGEIGRPLSIDTLYFIRCLKVTYFF
jgi:hypothetical protein